MSAIELQGEYGEQDIEKVAVLLTNGQSIAIDVQRELDTRPAPNLRIDLGPAARIGVNRVIVYGTGGGEFRVLGA